MLVCDTMSIRLMILRITDISPMMVCLTVDSPTAILPNVCKPNYYFKEIQYLQIFFIKRNSV